MDLNHYKRPYGNGGIRTLAPLSRPTPLAGAPLQPTWVRFHMAPQVGFEPTTDRLTADSSTTELLRNSNILPGNVLL